MSITATVLRILSTIAGALLPKGKQLYAERSAGKVPESVPINIAEEILDEALTRLGAVDVDQSWWKHALVELGATTIRPDWFKKPHVQEWLSQADVRRLLKLVANANLTGAEVHREYHEALVASYMEHSYENRQHAESVISLAASVLKASIMGAARDPGTAAIVQANAADQRELLVASSARIDKLINLNERQLELLQSTRGIPREALIDHLVRLGARKNIGADEIPQFLERFADEFQKVQEQLVSDEDHGPEVLAVRHQVSGLVNTGNLDEARAKLNQAREQIHALRMEYSRDEAVLLADEANIARLQTEYRLAAKQFAEASRLVAFDAVVAAGYARQQGLALWLQGEEFGDNQALIESIALFRNLINDAKLRTLSPLDWAVIQDDLGNALVTLGRREGATTRLEEAIVAYSESLGECTRELAPLQWATIQNDLANALQSIGERESNTVRLEKAVDAYRKALTVRIKSSSPLDWAATQNNLGLALQRIGERENGTQRLRQALSAFHEALKERTRDRAPLHWAATQNNLGYTLYSIGEREDRIDDLYQAVDAYRESLKEYTRARTPLFWAMVQTNLGLAFQRIGERKPSIEMLKKAVEAYRASLEERTREREPLSWASTQSNLGNALEQIGRREGSLTIIEEAVIAHGEALKEITAETAPLQWATIIGNQGKALLFLAERRDDLFQAELALKNLTAAFEMLSHSGITVYAKLYEDLLPEARALLMQLRSRS